MVDEEEDVVVVEVEKQKGYQPVKMPRTRLPTISQSRYFDPSFESEIGENPTEELLKMVNHPKTIKYSSYRKTEPVKYPTRDVQDTRNFCSFVTQEPHNRKVH